MPGTQHTQLLLGSRYRLLHEVGKGGMALVYEAYDQMLERPVAIKLLKQDFSSDPGFQDRFRQEAKSAANLSHPNIVTVHDFGEDPAGIYIVMEYISGTDLKSKILEKGRYSIEEGVLVISQACAGLGYAHRAGIIHCDVKPHNILIAKDSRVKITDFGIARALSTITSGQKSEYVWGSPLYFSPEQALGEIPTPASDVYSLGVVIYEMLTGKLPFEAKDVDGLISLHRLQFPLPPRMINPEIPPALEQLILKLLSKEPTSRYRTADQVGHILSRIMQDSGWINIPITNSQIPSVSSSTIRTIPPPITPEDYPGEQKKKTDWRLIGLELLALLMVGGLIPFWLMVWFKISPFLR